MIAEFAAATALMAVAPPPATVTGTGGAVRADRATKCTPKRRRARFDCRFALPPERSPVPPLSIVAGENLELRLPFKARHVGVTIGSVHDDHGDLMGLVARRRPGGRRWITRLPAELMRGTNWLHFEQKTPGGTFIGYFAPVEEASSGRTSPDSKT